MRATITKKAAVVGERTVKGPVEVEVYVSKSQVEIHFDDGSVEIESKNYFDNIAVYRTMDQLFN